MARFEIVFLKPPDGLRGVPEEPFENPLGWLIEDDRLERVYLDADTVSEAHAETDLRLAEHPAAQQAFAFCVVDRERDVMMGLSLLREQWIGRVDQESMNRLFDDDVPPQARH